MKGVERSSGESQAQKTEDKSTFSFNVQVGQNGNGAPEQPVGKIPLEAHKAVVDKSEKQATKRSISEREKIYRWQDRVALGAFVIVGIAMFAVKFYMSELISARIRNT
ncbi:MAG: hypothetical protein LBF94_00490 [Puniceicoccales bacterium]|jgi:hypothetical protein|nr:hypothetical protein [Puniceicoccales bacterium]